MAVTPTLTDDLYHYTSADIALDCVMTQMQLRLGLFETMNDPRESKPRYPTLQLAHGVSDHGIDDIWQEADRLLRRAVKVACFTLDYELPESVLDPAVLRGYAHPAMWAHYGGRHAGVCLRFSRSALEERMNAALSSRGHLFAGPVQYSFELFGQLDASPFDIEQMDEFGVDAVVVRYIEEHHSELFFRKHPDWSNEREYRWILIEPEPLPVYVDITGCLTGVVLGDNFAESRLGALHQLAGRFDHLDITKVNFQNGRLQVVPPPTPQAAVSRAHRRPGTQAERVSALAQAEELAMQERGYGDELASPVIKAIEAGLQQIAERAGTLGEVDVSIHSSINAVPEAERQRAPGVSTRSSIYDRGVMCVVENLPVYSLTFVASAAVQVFADGLLKMHAALELEKWGSSGNERVQLWRVEREVEAIAAAQSANELTAAMLSASELALSTFDEHRDTLRPK
jgi:hypothetical protein